MGILPLMAVLQPTKGKVRPVLDFRKLNQHVENHTGSGVIDMCDEMMREWRQMGGASKIVDLKSAYFQLHVSIKLWKYRLVKYKEKTYCLMRIGLRLGTQNHINDPEKILEEMRNGDGVSSYIDDILVNEAMVMAKEVVIHLKESGLVAKIPGIVRWRWSFGADIIAGCVRSTGFS